MSWEKHHLLSIRSIYYYTRKRSVEIVKQMHQNYLMKKKRLRAYMYKPLHNKVTTKQ